MSTPNLREPDPMDWDNHNPKSSYSPPPPAKDAAGNYITYTAKLPKDLGSEARLGVTDEGYRKYEFGPLQLQLPGGKTHEIRFFTASVKKFTKKDGTPMEVSGVSKILRGAGFAGKPQTTAEYDAAVRSLSGRNIQVTIEWKGKNRDTGEEIDGFDLFPVDPDRPGQRKAVVKQGEMLPSGETLKGEVLFANARVRYVESK